jgi:hypothetical protein
MVTEHVQTGSSDGIDHGLGEAFLRVEKVAIDSLDIDKQVL